MSMVKDLLLISLFLIMIIRYIMLYQNLIRQRNYFIDTLSHDLRVSTIAQIRGLEVLQKKLHLCQPETELLKDIHNSCKFTLDMITMLLNTYQYENGEPVLNYETLNLSEIIFSSCHNLSSPAEEKGVDFCYEIDSNSNIQGDKTALYKVLLNLVSTAIFNAERNSTIYLNVKNTTKELKVSIIYYGKALTDEECRRMFMKKPKFSTVGHGIKMHLCKKIIEFHRGRIFVENCGKNINSFTFTIPVKQKEKIVKQLLISTLQPSKL